jgi:hypothetical protein
MELSHRKMVTALRELGFDAVFDTNFAGRPHDHGGGYRTPQPLTRVIKEGKEVPSPCLQAAHLAVIKFAGVLLHLSSSPISRPANLLSRCSAQ